MALEDKDLKTRLTDTQIADLEANLPLADIIGKHEDHRLKIVPDEVLLMYNLAPSFGRYEFIHNTIGTTSTQILEKGIYFCTIFGPTWNEDSFSSSRVHIEMLVNGTWEDVYLKVMPTAKEPLIFPSDGVNVRIANAHATETSTLVGVRVY